RILRAQGEKESAILAAEAEKEVKIREAEGEAEAIERVQSAVAIGLMKINEANPSDKAMLLKSYETLAKVANGKATKLVIPSDLQSLASYASVIKDVLDGGEK
ncbi:MAG: peptidase, partial [Clostridiales bacterium]|nr:peptidase [Clostridiales bacterium]